MKPLSIKENKHFIGRQTELATLKKISQIERARIIVVYGKRRVGKTELLEQAFRKRNIIKFEGLEGKSESAQKKFVIQKLAEYTQEPLLKKIHVETWTEIFSLISNYISQGKWTLYFEELQWLADYRPEFISELKYVWDNIFRHNKDLIIILCGSSPSFMINQVLKSKALYNRSQYEIPLKEFNLIETKQYLSHRSLREVMDAYLTVGGLPEYLHWVHQESSVFLGICKNTFISGAFFSNEYERIFTSSLSSNKYYRKIIDFLSKQHFSTRSDIAKNLKISSGGTLTDLLTDLEICGFIQKYAPYNLKEDGLLVRYCISDAYLQFYFKFVKPLDKRIANGDFNKNPTQALNTESYYKWLGFSFERFCRKFHRVIAAICGFSAIDYQVGSFFNRETQKAMPGYQIDLVFFRKDNVYTICEIKYLQTQVSSRVIQEFEKKLELFPKKEKITLQKVLITTIGPDKPLQNAGYFDRIITLEDLFNLNYW